MRNAKNLRGQYMEWMLFLQALLPVKPVAVAEVELCLDNSDGTASGDYTEVSIGRRMYRSGESEYLINGAIVRRMDVLDILHDSGFGVREPIQLFPKEILIRYYLLNQKTGVH